jgi:hypothetical protein
MGRGERFAAKTAARQSFIAATETIVEGGSSLFSRYSGFRDGGGIDRTLRILRRSSTQMPIFR